MRRVPHFSAPFASAAETYARIKVLSISCISPVGWPHPANARKNTSNVPTLDKRRNRFHIAFRLPNSADSARLMILLTVN
jgi:hypothetical protein